MSYWESATYIDDVEILKSHLKHILNVTKGDTKFDIVDYNEVIAYIQGYINAVLFNPHEKEIVFKDEKDG